MSGLSGYETQRITEEISTMLKERFILKIEKLLEQRQKGSDMIIAWVPHDLSVTLLYFIFNNICPKGHSLGLNLYFNRCYINKVVLNCNMHMNPSALLVGPEVSWTSSWTPGIKSWSNKTDGFEHDEDTGGVLGMEDCILDSNPSVHRFQTMGQIYQQPNLRVVICTRKNNFRCNHGLCVIY